MNELISKLMYHQFGLSMILILIIVADLVSNPYGVFGIPKLDNSMPQLTVRPLVNL
jgi:hypothetical protein